MKLTFRALEAVGVQQIYPAKVRADLKAARAEVVATQEQFDHRLHPLLCSASAAFRVLSSALCPWCFCSPLSRSSRRFSSVLPFDLLAWFLSLLMKKLPIYLARLASLLLPTIHRFVSQQDVISKRIDPLQKPKVHRKRLVEAVAGMHNSR